MPNPNNEIIKQLRTVIQNGGGIDANTRDVLLFSAIIDIYEQFDAYQTDMRLWKKETEPAVTFAKFGIWFVSIFGVSVVGLLFALMTGRAELVIK